MRRLAAPAALALVAAAPAQAELRRDFDDRTKMRLTLDGKVLTVEVVRPKRAPTGALVEVRAFDRAGRAVARERHPLEAYEEAGCAPPSRLGWRQRRSRPETAPRARWARGPLWGYPRDA
jgi:hypothetical protein